MSHAEHRDAGVNIDSPRGTRWTTTFRKEPMIRPTAPNEDAITAGTLTCGLSDRAAN
jgi:hypothetical protein